jgi:hypothetical protein
METKNKMNPSHFLLPGCMFIGMGIGFIFNIVPVGILIGMGVGFLATAIYKMYTPKTEKHGKEI